MFTFPISMELVNPEHRENAVYGILLGIITIPLGCLAGGILGGITLGILLKQMVPVFVVSAILAVSLVRFQTAVIHCLITFGKITTIWARIGLALGAVQVLTGYTVLPGMGSLDESFQIVGHIVVFLSGAFPMIFIVRHICRNAFARIGEKSASAKWRYLEC